jgi:tRNA (guanine26-N2/guanine27-N2)-dimethyltransferase
VGDERVRVTNRSLEETLADPAARFDFIDIDPYGSPVKFLTAAAGRVARGGYIALTATDLGALCGAFPHACLRRYGAAPLHNEWMKETAARILLGAAARKAAAIDRTIEPVLTIATLHFIRAIYRVDKDRRAGKAGARHLGFVKPDPEYREAPRVVGLEQLLEDASALAGKGPAAGPLWTGPLHSPPLLAKIGRPGRSPATGENEGPMEAWPFRHFLEAAPGESEMPPYFFSLDEAARRLKTSPPTTAKAVEALTARGHESCRTHFDTKGVKTRASPAAFLDAVAALTHRR